MEGRLDLERGKIALNTYPWPRARVGGPDAALTGMSAKEIHQNRWKLG